MKRTFIILVFLTIVLFSNLRLSINRVHAKDRCSEIAKTYSTSPDIIDFNSLAEFRTCIKSAIDNYENTNKEEQDITSCNDIALHYSQDKESLSMSQLCKLKECVDELISQKLEDDKPPLVHHEDDGDWI